MKVIFCDTMAGVDFVYRIGKEYEIDTKRAKKWIAAGICKPASTPKPKKEVKDEPKPKSVESPKSDSNTELPKSDS